MSDDTTGSLVSRLVLWAIGVFVALTLLGWVVGALLHTLRLFALISFAVAVAWAIGSARARD